MSFYRKSLTAILLSLCVVMSALAQSGTNSPYSQYGLGQMSDQTSGFNRGMNGLGLGFREHNQVNFLNPASYSAMDSLTFIFDVGLSGQITNFKQGDTKVNANNADFEYAVAGFRLFKHVGFSFGILPLTNVGYDYSVYDYLNDDKSAYYTNTYSGSGGVHQIYIGAGWEILKGLSIGANVSYIWGDYDRSVVNAYSDSYVTTLSKYYSASIHSFKYDFGLQYSFNLSKKNNLTVGLTFSPKVELNADPECKIISSNSSSGIADTTSFSIKDGLQMPTTIGAGFIWDYNNKLKLGADVNYQKWGDLSYPVYNVVNNVPVYELSDDFYSDRYKFTVGGQYCKNEYGRSFFDRIRYRLGASYATPYYKINGEDGPKEISVSAGFGIPIVNSYNNRSILNISCQWVHASAKSASMITENTFRINIGITFNERWFMKWKVD